MSLMNKWHGRVQRRTRNILGLLTVPLILAGGLGGLAGPAAAASTACIRVTGLQPPSPGMKDDNLAGVASFNGCDAWAVGDVDGTALIEQWNGASWTQVPSNATQSQSNLNGVTVVSPSNAWAVGASGSSGFGQTLIEHWNGSAWSVVPSPSPGTGTSILSGVANFGASNVWAVGRFFDAATGTFKGQIQQWNGSSWTLTNSLGAGTSLAGVAAVSATSAWVVGSTSGASGQQQTLIEQWNGASGTWSAVPSPSPAGESSQLSGVTATSSTDAWAVGSVTGPNGGTEPLIEHWDGTSWTVVSAPTLTTGIGGELSSVTANSTRNAFAVGEIFTSAGSGGAPQPLLERWEGSSWAQVPAPSLGSSGTVLSGVSASSQDVWMSGNFNPGTGPTQAALLHCC